MADSLGHPVSPLMPASLPTSCTSLMSLIVPEALSEDVKEELRGDEMDALKTHRW
jgi:hypothetical protein